MRIVNRKEFIAMPENTVYCDFSPCNFGPIRIKGESIIFDTGNDFFCQTINDAIKQEGSDSFFGQLFKACDDSSLELEIDFDYTGRDGLFDYDQLYAVWNDSDVSKLINRLKETLEKG